MNHGLFLRGKCSPLFPILKIKFTAIKFVKKIRTKKNFFILNNYIRIFFTYFQNWNIFPEKISYDV